MEISSNSAANYAVQGMQNGFERLDIASGQIANPKNPDPTQPLLDTKFSETQVQASAKAFKAVDGNIGTLLDIFA